MWQYTDKERYRDIDISREEKREIKRQKNIHKSTRILSLQQQKNLKKFTCHYIKRDFNERECVQLAITRQMTGYSDY